MISKAADVFKSIIKKANTPLKEAKELRYRDQKAVITKALNRYVKYSYSPLKLSGVVFDGTADVTYSVIITPESPIAIVSFMKNEELIHDRLSFTRLSDYIVRNEGFDSFQEQIPKVTAEKGTKNATNILDSL